MEAVDDLYDRTDEMKSTNKNTLQFQLQTYIHYVLCSSNILIVPKVRTIRALVSLIVFTNFTFNTN
jgi:hypothetical protein